MVTAEGLTKEEVATDLLTGRAFAYENFDPTGSEPDNFDKAFQSDLMLSLLGTTHLQDTIGWVEAPGFDLLAACDHGIRGVLALCTAAVISFFCVSPTTLTTLQQLERALKLAEEGRLGVIVDQEALTEGQEAVDAHPVRGMRMNHKQPRMLNQATGKASTKGTAFSHQNWGSQTG